MVEKIAAVIVTFNRVALLEKTINALKTQTQKVDAIIVVNNGSTDGTAEWLDQQAELLVFHQGNEGGAGGFHRGMKESYDRGFDWIWIMDDDVMPKSDCLEIMSRYFKKYKVLVPIKVQYESGAFIESSNISYNLDNILKKRTVPVVHKYATQESLPEELYIADLSFEGPIFAREVIEKVGLPIKEFFIFGDDAEYGIRIRERLGEKLCLLKHAIFYRLIDTSVSSSSVKTPFAYWRLYYFVRNVSTIYFLHSKNVLMKSYPIILAFKNTLLGIKKRDFKFIKISWQATSDAYRKNMIKRYLPSSKI